LTQDREKRERGLGERVALRQKMKRVSAGTVEEHGFALKFAREGIKFQFLPELTIKRSDCLREPITPCKPMEKEKGRKQSRVTLVKNRPAPEKKKLRVAEGKGTIG